MIAKVRGEEVSLDKDLVSAELPTNAGLVDQLLACPVKGYFVPVDSESTDAL